MYDKNVRSVILSVLLGMLFGGGLLAIPTPQDPPLPNAGAYCAMTHADPAMVCTCAAPPPQDDEEGGVGGVACTRNPDTNRPRWCKWMCGHAKMCGCCQS